MGPLDRTRFPWTAKTGFRSFNVRGASRRSIDSLESGGLKWSSVGRVPTSRRFLPMIESLSWAESQRPRRSLANFPFMVLGMIDGSFMIRTLGVIALPCILVDQERAPRAAISREEPCACDQPSLFPLPLAPKPASAPALEREDSATPREQNDARI